VLESFDSGKATLTEWLQRHALLAGERRTGRTFVWHRHDKVVVAYYTLAAHTVEADDVSRSIAHGGPSRIPAVLLARLALDRSLHGTGRGGALLSDALSRALDASRTVAARLVVVDAIDEEAEAFYRHFKFKQTPVGGRLVMKMSDVEATYSGLRH
jgi:GNAT superfamily N-acetyltransferase